MGNHIVYWDSGTNDGVIHESPNCQELRHVISIHRGTQEEARQTGRVKRCPYCSSKPEVRESAEPPTMRRSYSIMLALLAACCVWVGCAIYYDGMADTAYSSGYAAAQADAETTASERYRAGYDTGKEIGYKSGKREGYNSGYTEGYFKGKDAADTNTAYNNGYNDGYATGYDDGIANSYANSTPAYSDSESSYSNNYTVYITATGNKYHSWGCQYLRNSCYSITLSDAIAQGYTACSRCKP